MRLILCALAGFSDFFMRDEIAEFIRSILFYLLRKKGKGLTFLSLLIYLDLCLPRKSIQFAHDHFAFSLVLIDGLRSGDVDIHVHDGMLYMCVNERKGLGRKARPRKQHQNKKDIASIHTPTLNSDMSGLSSTSMLCIVYQPVQSTTDYFLPFIPCHDHCFCDER